MVFFLWNYVVYRLLYDEVGESCSAARLGVRTCTRVSNNSQWLVIVITQVFYVALAARDNRLSVSQSPPSTDGRLRPRHV